MPPLQLRGQGRARGKAVSGREALEYNMKMEAEKRTAADRAREEAKHEYAAVKKDTKAFLRKEKRENRRRREEADGRRRMMCACGCWWPVVSLFVPCSLCCRPTRKT